MRNPWKLTSVLFATLFAASAAIHVAAADPQPKMREALGDLRGAVTKLEQATADKGGHRAKAIELTKKAIDEVEAGIKFDNKH